MTLSSRPEGADVLVTPATQALKILAASAILALLYVGREVLVPITLALILSLLVSPLVRMARRCGLGQVGAVLSAVGLVSLVLAGVAFAIVLQLSSMGQKLPEYEQTLRAKVQVVQSFAARHLDAFEGESANIFGRVDGHAATGSNASPNSRQGLNQAKPSTAVVPVEVREPHPTPLAILLRVLSSVSGPVGTAAVVLITLIFALLEHASLRDRFIRLIGSRELRATTHALNDAGERLSRYFVSQLGINVGVGAVLGVALACLGVPQALLWATLTALLRFVPYVGIFVAAACVAAFTAAVEPGWALCIYALAAFAAVEVLASQVVEPWLYGHSTGLSPISVVLAAVFWSWIWGPIGLLLSTPMTLCLVVAGRHVKSLAFLEILFGDTAALTLSERFYQRSLAGDANELIADCRRYLEHHSLARYCDDVMMPAFRMASVDFEAGTISPVQESNVRRSITALLSMVGPEGRRAKKRARSRSPIGIGDPGTELRRQREAELGKWQGSLNVGPGTITLCVGVGLPVDDLGAEILVRVLRDAGADARHLSLADFADEPPEASADSVALVILVGMTDEGSDARTRTVAHALQQIPLLLPRIGFFPLATQASRPEPEQNGGLHVVLRTYEEAIGFVRAKPETGQPVV